MMILSQAFQTIHMHSEQLFLPLLGASLMILKHMREKEREHE